MLKWSSQVVALLVVVGLVGVRAPVVGAGATVDVVVDGGQRFQPIDGFGVNANPKLWNGGELRAAIDELVGLGSTLWRVDIDGNSAWEAQNDDADPFAFNWGYYNTVYE